MTCLVYPIETMSARATAGDATDRLANATDRVANATDRVASLEAAPLLRLRDLSVSFGPGQEVLRRVNLTIDKGEIVGLVGESGSGKTLTALSILGLLPPGARTEEGQIWLDGTDNLLQLDEKQRRQIRARRLAMIFQEPMSALNPVFSLGYQIGEVLRLGGRMDRGQARREARRLLERVAMPDPERRLRSFPHQLSGGQLQRAMIAMALAAGPDLLLADEPTTALDVTVQAQVLELLTDLRSQLGLAVLLITHDLGVVAQCCDRVVVMYSGQVVEEAPVEELFSHPSHPYTRALLDAVPKLDGRDPSFLGIPGRVPEIQALPSGCTFHPRCRVALETCSRSEPDLYSISSIGEAVRGQHHSCRCFLVEDR